MSIKKWVSLGIVYVVLVVLAYGLMTGNNPFQSGKLDHNHETSEVTIIISGGSEGLR